MDSATLDGRQPAVADPAIPGGADGREDPRAGRPVPPTPRAADPGRCSDHPGILLVRPSRLHVWDGRRQRVLCTSLEHDAYDCERCVYCGGPLWTDGRAPDSQGLRRSFCSETCRNYLWRWRRRSLAQMALPAELVP